MTCGDRKLNLIDALYQKETALPPLPTITPQPQNGLYARVLDTCDVQLASHQMEPLLLRFTYAQSPNAP
jgi:hypothetical protein